MKLIKMPYIKQSDRKNIDQVVEIIREIGIKPNGEPNYLLFKLCKETIEPSYNNYKNFIAELTECSEEIRRRLLAPYEDQKIKENGDVE